jgi:predicted GIY-YIG superfamily endonuclease
MTVIPICSSVTYVLRLEGDNYYVGWTTNLNRRLTQHWTGKGAGWTKHYQPVELIRIVEGNQEEKLTIRAMKWFGVRNVRGYSWTQVAPREKKIRMMERGLQKFDKSNLPAKLTDIFMSSCTVYT